MKKYIAIAMSLIVISFMFGCGHSSGTIEKNTLSQNIEDVPKATVPDVINKNLPEALSILGSQGFKYLTSNTEGIEWDSERWIVTEQSIPAGNEVPLDENIILDCKKLCRLYLDLHSEANLFLSTYDMDIFIDQLSCGSVSNGQTITFLADVLEGEHIVTAINSGNDNVSASKKISIMEDITFSSDLAHGGSIEFKNIQIINNVELASLTVDDVVGEVLSNAKERLEQTGFSNIREEPYGEIWDSNNWVVVSQSVEPGTNVDKNTLIKLNCIKKEILDTYSYAAAHEGSLDEDIMKKLVGVYKGGNGSRLIIKRDHKADYYFDSADAFNEYGCPWAYADGKIFIKLSKLSQDLHADVSENNTDLFFVSNRSLLWDAELFTKLDDNPDNADFYAPETSSSAETQTENETTRGVVESTYKAATEKKQTSTVLTKDNNEDLAALLDAEYLDPDTQAAFSSKYRGETIEFDCIVLYVEKYPNYDTIFDFVLLPGTDEDHVGAALFMVEQAQYYSFKFAGNNRPEAIKPGIKMHIQAEVKAGSDPMYVYLKPIKTWVR